MSLRYCGKSWLPARTIVANSIAARHEAHESREIIILKQSCPDCHTVEGLIVNFEDTICSSPPLLPTKMLDAVHQSLRILVLQDAQFDEKHDICQQIPKLFNTFI